MSLSLAPWMGDTSTMNDEIFWPWFAGLFEGEGTIGVTKPTRNGGRYLRMSMGMTDEDVLRRVQERLGGSLSGPKKTLTPRGTAGKDMYYWQLGASEVVREIALRILPLLGNRRSAAVQRCLAEQQYALVPTEGERFWSHVDQLEGGCWLWTGHLDAFGFGTAWTKGNGRYQAHRYAWEFEHGEAPPRLKNICGTKSCVRPAHWRRDGKMFCEAMDES